MSDFKIIDKDKKAEWILNTSEIRVADYVRHADNPGSEMIILEPGVPTKIIMSPYLDAQEVIKRIEDPTQGEGGIVFKVVKEEAPAKTEAAK